MTNLKHPNDLELAALISSKICHDVIGPVGAINNGLEILGDDDTADAQSYALDMIQSVTEQASARLQFARFAFGAAGSAGAMIDLTYARDIAESFAATIKHRLTWRGLSGSVAKDKVKLLLNLVSNAISALPRGGEIDVEVTGSLEAPEFQLTCRGRGARAPNYLCEILADEHTDPIDPMSIQAYYTVRLAEETEMRIAIARDAEDAIVISVR